MATYKFRMTVKPVDAREVDAMSKWRESNTFESKAFSQSLEIIDLRTDESRWQSDCQLSYIAIANAYDDDNPCDEGDLTLPESLAEQLSIKHPALCFQVDSCLLTPALWFQEDSPTTRSRAFVNGTEHATHLTPEMVYAALPNTKLCDEIKTLYKQVVMSMDVDEHDVDGAMYHLSELKRMLLREK